MPHQNLSFNCALITGGAGGLGLAMAKWLLSLNKKVIIAGRTESNLRSASASLSNAPYYVLDTGHVSSIPAFVEKLTTEHPDVDCLINNAGVQRPLYMKDFDLAKADQEIDINIRGPMHLSIALLPYFNSHSHAALIVNVSSILGYIPTSIINPVYNGTKAWLHFWSMNLRTQLRQEGSRVGVIEIVPPTVGTDLHRERENPKDNWKENNSAALTVEEFMEDLSKGWEAGEEVIAAGKAKGIVERWYGEYGGDYAEASGGK